MMQLSASQDYRKRFSHSGASKVLGPEVPDRFDAHKCKIMYASQRTIERLSPTID